MVGCWGEKREENVFGPATCDMEEANDTEEED